ncbi:MAG: acyl-CoA dehydrogenase family protein [Polaromonas sp.]|uniref:acyl-CoA dehydrogenase family protein n=1 Tax=unclassified Polaromonas TaxID=2638319 RepID=UPI000BBC8263|nr:MULTISPECIES: acyl-CoA dehydrogenase family protein [unclassified Polaromonas]MDP2451365.1 acyl-CoA dehydrogenase family protein [Polaromonas sp.]MDP3825827.1 acyl-CoA dehydrogenase family protein [Polaromonas sp.]
MIETLSLQPLPLQAEALRAEVRSFLDEKLRGVPPDRRARSWLGFDADFSRALGERGWIGMALPQEYGGGGRDAFARFVLVEELLARGAPVSAHWIAERQSAPMVLRFGTEAQRRFFVPRVCKGELFFCIGMSEPQSGSDLASVRTRATPTPDGWRLKGQKIWTTNADHSHWMIALVRTSGTPEDRQVGLSQLLIDMKATGVTVRPIEDLTGDRHFSEVFFDDVELPHDALIGEEGSGWKQVNAELAFERSGPERLYSSMVLLDTWIDHLRDVRAPDEQALALAGRIVGHLAALRSMSVAVTARVGAGGSPMTEASLVKDLGTELEQYIPIAIADAIASDTRHVASPALMRTLAYVTQFAPTFSLRGGTREVLRGLIARGLGLR